MDVDEFRNSVRSLTTFAEELWIEVEFYKSYIREAGPMSKYSLEELAAAASRNTELRACAHRLFSIIVDMIILDMLDARGTDKVIESLLKTVQPGRPN